MEQDVSYQFLDHFNKKHLILCTKMLQQKNRKYLLNMCAQIHTEKRSILVSGTYKCWLNSDRYFKGDLKLLNKWCNRTY